MKAETILCVRGSSELARRLLRYVGVGDVCVKKSRNESLEFFETSVRCEALGGW